MHFCYIIQQNILLVYETFIIFNITFSYKNNHSYKLTFIKYQIWSIQIQRSINLKGLKSLTFLKTTKALSNKHSKLVLQIDNSKHQKYVSLNWNVHHFWLGVYHLLIPNILTPCNCGSFGITPNPRAPRLKIKCTVSYLV